LSWKQQGTYNISNLSGTDKVQALLKSRVFLDEEVDDLKKIIVSLRRNPLEKFEINDTITIFDIGVRENDTLIVELGATVAASETAQTPDTPATFEALADILSELLDDKMQQQQQGSDSDKTLEVAQSDAMKKSLFASRDTIVLFEKANKDAQRDTLKSAEDLGYTGHIVDSLLKVVKFFSDGTAEIMQQKSAVEVCDEKSDDDDCHFLKVLVRLCFAVAEDSTSCYGKEGDCETIRSMINKWSVVLAPYIKELEAQLPGKRQSIALMFIDSVNFYDIPSKIQSSNRVRSYTGAPQDWLPIQTEIDKKFWAVCLVGKFNLCVSSSVVSKLMRHLHPAMRLSTSKKNEEGVQSRSGIGSRFIRFERQLEGQGHRHHLQLLNEQRCDKR